MNSTRAPADTGASCGVSYAIAWQTPSDSPPDFGATVTVTNNSPYPISGWTVSWSFTAGQTIVAGSSPRRYPRPCRTTRTADMEGMGET